LDFAREKIKAKNLEIEQLEETQKDLRYVCKMMPNHMYSQSEMTEPDIF
jgi:hypothetical protein